MVTTASYAPGVVALALSLEAAGSRGRLRALATNKAALDALLLEAAVPPRPTRLDIELFEVQLPEAAPGAPTHHGRGATFAVDMPRRELWSRGWHGFVLLDSDMVALQNPDLLLDALQESGASSELLAVPAFRLKQRAFGSSSSGGGFNAGVMVVPRTSPADSEQLAALVASPPRVEDTEESLLNEVFRGRWAELPRGYNCPKRVRAHAPQLWRQMLQGGELVFLHFLGAKPWMCDEQQRRAADWEEANPAYAALEQLVGPLLDLTANALTLFHPTPAVAYLSARPI